MVVAESGVGSARHHACKEVSVLGQRRMADGVDTGEHEMNPAPLASAPDRASIEPEAPQLAMADQAVLA